jgi:hypothetical protein
MKTTISFELILIYVISLFLGPLYSGMAFAFLFSEILQNSFVIDEKSIIIISSAIMFIVFAIFFSWDYKYNYYWKLDRKILRRGKPCNFEIDLESIEMAFWNHDINTKYLVMKLPNTHYFALDLYSNGNGKKLMEKVENIVSKKMVSDFYYIREHNFDWCSQRVHKRNKLITF